MSEKKKGVAVLALMGLFGLYYLSRAREEKKAVAQLPPLTQAKVEEVSEIAKDALKVPPEQAPEVHQELGERLRELEQVAESEGVPKETAYQAVMQKTVEKLQKEGYQIQPITAVSTPKSKPQPLPAPPTHLQPVIPETELYEATQYEAPKTTSEAKPQPVSSESTAVSSQPSKPSIPDICGVPPEVSASPSPDRLNAVDGCPGGFRKTEVYQIYTGEWKSSVTVYYSEVRKPPFVADYTINLSDVLSVVKPSSGKIGINVTDPQGLGELHIYVDGVEKTYGIIGYRGYVEVPIKEYTTVRIEYKPKVQANQDILVDIVAVMYS